MEIVINNQTRYFDDRRIKLWEKIFPVVKIWYIVFPVLYLLYLIVFVNDLEDTSIFIPFYLCFIIFVLNMLLSIFVPNGNNKYIMAYYPEIAKKLGLPGNNTLNWMKFLKHEYIDYGKDEIIDKIIKHTKQQNSMFIIVFFGYALLLDILGLIIVGIKI